MKPAKIGVIGCGNISGVYLRVAKTFPVLDVVAVSDIVRERAEEKAAEFGIPKVVSTDELIGDPEIEFLLNLTIPKVHGEIGLKTVDAGKHLYNEKPFAPTREEATTILRRAKEKGVLVGGAPDTFLGAGLQTCRKLIDDGWIGEPVAATAFWGCHGHENWHPDPEFFFKPGAGPMFDMGPYPITALVALIGPVTSVAAHAGTAFATRTVTSEPRRGQVITVDTPTHVTGTMQFAGGAIATVLTSYDMWANKLPNIEVHGTAGSMILPDPNTFGGEILVQRGGAKEWTSVPHTHGYAEQNRSIGLADMVYAARTGRKHRASGELAYHVLDVMQSFLDSAREKRHVELASTVDRPAPLPMNLAPGTLDGAP